MYQTHELIQEDLESKFWKKPIYFKDGSESSSTSLDSSISGNPSLNNELHRPSIYHTQSNEKRNTFLKKTKSLDDSNGNSKFCKLKYRPSLKKHATIKDTNSKLFGKHSFKRGLRKDTSRRREGDRASRIANSRRCSNNSKLTNNVRIEGGWKRKAIKENVPFLHDEIDNLKDFWNFTNISNIRNEKYNEITSDSNIEGKAHIKDFKGKMVRSIKNINKVYIPIIHVSTFHYKNICMHIYI